LKVVLSYLVEYIIMSESAVPAAATPGAAVAAANNKENVNKPPSGAATADGGGGGGGGGNAASSTGGYQVPWVEKYRPRTLDDVVGNEETVIRLRAIAKDGNMPNLILCGPPGTGKTTSVHALARELLGSSYKDAVLELNASDARGIDVRRFFAPVPAKSGTGTAVNRPPSLTPPRILSLFLLPTTKNCAGRTEPHQKFRHEQSHVASRTVR